MTDQSSDKGWPDDWDRGGYVPGEQYHGAGASGSSRPGSGMPGQGGSGYGNPGQGGAGYGTSGQGGGAGAARPGAGTPGQAGAPGPGMPTSPIWQATPGQATPGQAGQGQGAPGQAGFGPNATPPSGGQPMGSPAMGRPQAADAQGFLGALFDFSFTSFVTTKIIKVLYALIMVLVSLSALVFTISAFRSSAVFGLLVLVIGDPLFIIIVMAFWRLVLESFVVVFRIAEDIRALRERGGR
jgi:Domain of unknown function (DUF4282)